ncbi:MAG: DUF2157 domain-containing protein [Clostridiales bacterium]|nr:DUF2157 domain-containing protein [Clostridiales bacterium]
MSKEEWLISEVDKWQDDSIIDVETGEKIKKQYELYRNFNINIFAILCAIFGATLIVSGIGLISFYNWKTIPSVLKIIIAVSPLIISYVMSIYTVIFKTENSIWKESSAFLNVAAMFFALGIIVSEFHFELSFSQYLILASVLSVPIIYIMQAVSPLIIYYTAILLWGSLNISLGSAPILLLLFLLGTGVIGFHIKKFGKTFRYNACISALAGLPFMVLFTKMLNGDVILAAFLYSTILFAARDVKRGYLHFKLISLVVSLITLITITLSQSWNLYYGEFGGITLGILTGITLLGSLAIEVFNTKENNYEFSYLLILMGLSIVRYIWGCLHLNSLTFQIIFMVFSIMIALLVAIGFVSLGKTSKRVEIASIGFGIIASLVLIKIFEVNLFFLWRAVSFLVLGSILLVLVIFLTGGAKKEETEKIEESGNKEQEENTEDKGEETDEEDNSNS